jgi:septum formation protein
MILASASPRRVELLKNLGYVFEVLPSDAEEIHDDQLRPGEVVKINAYRKARQVAKHHPDALVIAADTLVCLGRKLYGKPRDAAEAVQMLHELQGKTHEVVTGVCLMQLRDHRQTVFFESTQVTFRNLNPGQIDTYLASINPLDKAGAYAIQQGGEAIVHEIAGSFSNVVGLPVERLTMELNAWIKG